jgi:hypothetical protein
MTRSAHFFRVPLRCGGVAGVLLVLLAACAGEVPDGDAHAAEGPDHDAEMARDAEAELRENIAATAEKPPVITLDELSQRVGADAATRAGLARPVAALNAALVRLVDLHHSRDAAGGAAAPGGEFDQRAYRIHLEADSYENQIDSLLTEDQHGRFHSYLAERAEAVGIPLDSSHGSPDTGTMGNFSGIGHPSEGTHADGSPREQAAAASDSTPSPERR